MSASWGSSRGAMRTAGLVGIAGVAAGAAIAVGIAALQSRLSGRPAGLTLVQWRSAVDELGTIQGFEEVLELIRRGGCDPEVRADVWPFLLKVFTPDSTAAERAEAYSVHASLYHSLLQRCKELEKELDAAIPNDARAPEDAASVQHSIPPNLAQFAEAQRIIVMDALRTEIGQVSDAAGTVHYALPPSGLLGTAPREPIWRNRLAEEAISHAGYLIPDERRQALRLVALLSAYSVYDPEIGYCQGMSDLAAPLVGLLEDDVVAFWCFASMMKKARRNFRHDESGIRSQLRDLSRVLERADPVLYHRLRQIGAGDPLYAYRMVVVQMRRELSLPQVMFLWEIIWAEEFSYAQGLLPHHSELEQKFIRGGQGPVSVEALAGPPDEPFTDMLVCFIAAVVRAQRRRVLDDSHDLDDVLRLVNTVRIDLWPTVAAARQLFARNQVGA